jgi:hypothetical protein
MQERMFILENHISSGHENSTFLFELLLSKLKGQEQLPETITISQEEIEDKLKIQRISSEHIHDIVYRFANVWITLDGDSGTKRISLFSNSRTKELKHGNWRVTLSFSSAARETLNVSVLKEICNAISRHEKF